MGGAQHDEIRLAGASMQEDDRARVAVLHLNSDLHPCGLGRGAKLQ
jgi:hypothetical protein